MVKNLNDWMLKTYVQMREDAKDVVRRTIDNQRGAGAVEYGLVIGAVVVMIVAAAMLMDTPVRTFFTEVMNRITSLLGKQKI